MAGSKGRSGGDRTLSAFDLTAVDGGPECPARLPKTVKDKWRAIVEQVPKGVLREIDGHQLVLLAELLSGCDALAEQIHADPMNDKARRLFLQSCDRVNRLSAQFGLSPADRKRLNLQPENDEEDDFEKWKRGEPPGHEHDPAMEYKLELREANAPNRDPQNPIE